MRRATRLNRIVEHLRGRKTGARPDELARSYEVSVRTIERDLLDIQYEMGIRLDVKAGRYAIASENRLPPIDLELQEARAMLMATRLFLRYSDEFDPSATTAIEKLARIMPDEVRPQVMAAAKALSDRPYDADFSRNITTITQAWARRRVLKMTYRSAGKTRPKEVIVEPYFLEPSAAGFSTYLIGYSRTHQQMRTFKVERVVSAERLPETFTIAPDVDLQTLLDSAWGIIWGEGTRVRLRFAPDVTWRVKESRWHPSQQLDDLPDGGCLMTLSVASLMELGRWVRGWGDRVEVLEPQSLREELRDEAVRLARQYTRVPRVERRRAAASKKPREAGPRATPLLDNAGTTGAEVS